MNQAGYQAYRRNKYETASPHRLIQLLYEAAIANAGKAQKAIEDRQLSAAHASIIKTQEIVSELLACLNEEQGGKLATDLKRIYLYLIDRLVQANLRKQKEPVAEVERLLRELKSAWDQIGKEVSVGQA